MDILIPLVCIVTMAGLLGTLVYLIILLKIINRLTETNKQLLILVAGQGGKPEVTGGVMRALVASAKPPQGKLRGIAPDKKQKTKNTATNIDYEMEIGVR